MSQKGKEFARSVVSFVAIIGDLGQLAAEAVDFRKATAIDLGYVVRNPSLLEIDSFRKYLALRLELQPELDAIGSREPALKQAQLRQSLSSRSRRIY